MSVILAAFALSAIAPGSAPPPATAPIMRPVATKRIDGFRSARFRTTVEVVRRAILTEFPGATIIERLQQGEGTRVLQIVLPTLDPGPGEATVSYVFGAASSTLAQVSVTWATRGDAAEDDRQAIAIAGLRLGDYLRTGAQPRTVLQPRIVAGGAVSLYGALDESGAGIELVASGIPFRANQGPAVMPSGAAMLRLSYMANPAHPDVR